MDFAINTMTGKILHLLPLLDLVEGKYAGLKPQGKQQILFYEKAMGVFECLDTHSLKEDIATIYRGLGTFYALKYKHEKEMAKNPATEVEKQSSNPAHESEPTPAQVRNRKFEEETDETRERALFYLNYALDQDRKNVAALNDRAHFALIVEPLDYEKAKNLLEESKKIDPEQQRAFYNLAWIEHQEKEYHKSIESVEQALKRKRWQEGFVPERVADMHYHRACSSACVAKTEQGETRKSLLDSAINDLEIVANAEKASWKKLLEALEHDLKKGEHQITQGDLVVLLEDENLSLRVKAVRDTITLKATKVRD